MTRRLLLAFGMLIISCNSKQMEPDSETGATDPVSERDTEAEADTESDADADADADADS